MNSVGSPELVLNASAEKRTLSVNRNFYTELHILKRY